MSYNVRIVNKNKDENIENLLSRFKRVVKKENILNEYKLHTNYMTKKEKKEYKEKYNKLKK